jgi:nucleotide-binding universal stress UspA family protein
LRWSHRDPFGYERQTLTSTLPSIARSSGSATFSADVSNGAVHPDDSAGADGHEELERAVIQITPILCPVDFSQFSRDALDHAVALARWYRADVTVMHVFDIPPVPPPIAGFPVEATMLPTAVDSKVIADELGRFARQANADGDIKIEVLVSIGNAAAEIVRQAQRLPADLLTLGTHGRSGFERLFLGSVTEKVLRTTRVPTMTIPPPVKTPDSVPYRTILCPVDFSGESLRALEYALSLAQESDAEIIVLHVLDGFVDEPDLEELGDVHLRTYYQLVHDAFRHSAGPLSSSDDSQLA